MGEKNQVNIKVKVDKTELDEALEKTKKLEEKMQEVKSLADELTTCITKLNLKIKI